MFESTGLDKAKIAAAAAKPDPKAASATTVIVTIVAAAIIVGYTVLQHGEQIARLTFFR